MAIRESLVDDERDNITKDLDDLDVVYIEKMRSEGIDDSLINQFASLLNKMDEEQ